MPVTTRVSLIRSAPGRFETATVELDDPRRGEVMVKLAAAGMCHSDDHLATGDMPCVVFPFVGGHEGAGVICAVGPDTPGYAVGDHVVLSFLPVCGSCEFCAQGLSNLCDNGTLVLIGSRPEEPGSYRMSENGDPVGQMSGISTFSEYTTVSVNSVIKIDPSIPLRSAALLSCGVPTGWGSAVNSAQIGAGAVVIVMGIGGIGANALQGAAHRGARAIIAVDPAPFKSTIAPTFGATHTFTTIEEATDFARSITNGQGADATIVATGNLTGEHVASALDSIRKAGTVVVTGIGSYFGVGAPIPLALLTLFQKRLQGSLFGECNPRSDIPKLLRMYQVGALKIDELITREYTLDQIDEGYRDMHAGEIVRGVVILDRDLAGGVV